ncbi:alpha-1,3-mannosyl-glycoprotein 4-beta-N-acetylglucosaminyltransferase B-like [Pollicipes pollicipes]|uniref:alpha-1,3-mannosyl-glycoprotein 4-beta-N-acetylglucosaminyltransferase B-like n=1 Tax=Pollicipes pollicipes TaxID=41117 RepID=UPI00188576A8|nr:alpha-1,3-mannosyl-glycoprotein 4-beta-N-acetylglucosaminyltransferase B-like [Pollicipes pollicipes]XP_037076126.1 alpha-1,3-mannosyl-glycoprotein 4-beta-N-acetylglucosaminyltransferase B-like [Pollicipes pollicipes]
MAGARSRRQIVLFLAMFIFPFALIMLFNQPVDTRLERNLVQQLAELRERVQRAEVTNRERRRDVMILNHQIDTYNGKRASRAPSPPPPPPPPPPAVVGNSTVTPWKPTAPARSPLPSAAPLAHVQELNSDLEVPGLLNYLPHLLGHPHALTPVLHVSQGRRDVTVVMGLPTVKRQVQNYLIPTLKNLIDCMNAEERAQALIVVLIAETDFEYCTRTAREIQNKFPVEVDSGLVDIISPSADYYPPRETVRRTLDDPLERVQWRTKQNLDFAFLMMYCRPRGLFYVQLEDDIMTKPGYVTRMKEFALQKITEKKNWFLLDFCQLGFIGKLFKTVELLPLIHFLVMFNNDKPSDWLLINLVQTKVCRFDKSAKKCKEEKDKVWLHFKPSLFQHIGTHSSLKGKVQKLKDKQFGKVQMFVTHVNPPARIVCDMKPHKQYTLERAYKGETYFWGLLPQPGDHLEFHLTPPVRLTGFYFQSGNLEHPSDRFYNTTVEIIPEFRPEELLKEYKTTPDGYVIVGHFNDQGVAAGELAAGWGLTKSARLAVQAESDNWAILSEIHLKTS